MRNNLIALAGDQVWNEIALPELTAVDWRTAATQMATDLHAMLTRHPWLVQALGSYVVFGPGKARHDDHSLAIYEAAGFTGAQAGQAMAAVFTFVLGNALGPAAAASLTRKLSRDGGNAEELLRDSMAKAREIASRFPRLRPSLDTAAADYGAAPDNTFEFGLRDILDGLQAQLTPPAHQPTSTRPSHPATTKNPRPPPPPRHSRGQDPASWTPWPPPQRHQQPRPAHRRVPEHGRAGRQDDVSGSTSHWFVSLLRGADKACEPDRGGIDANHHRTDDQLPGRRG